MSKLKDIVEGYRNLIIPPEKLKEVIDIVGEERMKICEECEWHSKNHKTKRPDVHCFKCKCNLAAKTVCLHCSCPLDVPKWKAINSKINNDDK